eukprot:1160565-Pelagomonas_calceolata.AAC.4
MPSVGGSHWEALSNARGRMASVCQKRVLMVRCTATSGFWRVDLTLACLACWIMLLVLRLNFVCWADALNWRGTAGFLLQGQGELTRTWALLGA